MRKSTKIAVVLAAAALLVAGFAFTTLAKGWQPEGELWYYEDAYGMKEYMTWEKHEGKYFYLGEDGYMVVNKLVDYEGEYYWCGADGAKVVSQWVQVPADEMDQEELDVEYRWYYFDSKGRATRSKDGKAKKLTLDGKHYYFDTYGKMLYGYVDIDTATMKSEFDPAYELYCNTNEDGFSLESAWKKETDVSDQHAYEDETSFWTYYKSNGQRAVASANGQLVGGVRYYFDEDGHMLTSWQEATYSDGTTDATKSIYFGGADDGKMVKKAWVYAVPKSGDDKTNSTKRWFYFQNDGAALKFANGGVARINGRFYAFAEELDFASKMLSGMVKVTIPEGKTLPEATAATATLDLKPADNTAEAWTKILMNDVYYFSGDEANDGSLKKNTTFTVEFLDDTYTLNVDKEGKLSNGYISKRYYKNGLLIKASDDARYEIKSVWTLDSDGVKTDKNVLLSAAGTEVTKGYVADADGSYYAVKADEAGDLQIYRADSSLVAPGQAASAVYNGKKIVTAEGYDYDVVTTLEYDNVYKITLANGRVHK